MGNLTIPEYISSAIVSLEEVVFVFLEQIMCVAWIQREFLQDMEVDIIAAVRSWTPKVKGQTFRFQSGVMPRICIF
jgi:hypothetical protein